MKKIYILFLVFAFIMLNSCIVGRLILFNFADVNDYKKFPSRSIENGEKKFEFPIAEKGKAPKVISIDGEIYSFEKYLDVNKTVAFIIIQNDTIQYERYLKKYDKSSVFPSFSMAKSITSVLIGCAIEDNYITSVDEPITNYIPELKENGFDNVTIENLLQMTSGLNFNEGYFNPFSDAAKFYYATNLRKSIKKMELDSEPNHKFDYSSGNTQLLGLLLENSLKGKSISEYLEERIWKPLEMEFNASWSIDSKTNGLEKTFCCLSASARDYAKIGRLYLNKGNWNGKQIVSESWVNQSTKIDTTKGSVWNYQYQWWLPTKKGDYMAEGILGQYIYVNPTKNLIIVRLGEQEGRADWGVILTLLGEKY